MICSRTRVALSALALLIVASTANAESKWTRWFKSDFQSPPGARQRFWGGKVWPPMPRPTGPSEPMVHKYHRAHYWPHPYFCEDRAAVRSALAQQTANGWIAHTTLHGYHFDKELQELNHAGRLHLIWIVRHVPHRHRAAYVAAGESSDVSAKRLASVQTVAAEMAGDQGVPPISLRNAIPSGTPAEEIDLLRRAYLGSMPEPRLPFNGTNPIEGGGS